MPIDTPTPAPTPTAEAASLRYATGVFAPWLEKNAVLQDAVSPIAHPMNQGVDGHSGKISGANSESLFLKVLSKDQERWVRFENAVEMAKNAGNAGLSPRLIAADEAAKAFLFECLGEEWRPAVVLDLRTETLRETILTATKMLHDLPALGRNTSVIKQISELRRHMETGTRHVVTGATIKVTPPEDYARMSAMIDRIKLGFAAAANDSAPCHVENSLSNFMLGPMGAIKIVDFDRVANCDPLSDVGALCNEYCRTDDDVAQAVEIYSGHPHAATVVRVKLHMILAAFKWGMWGKVAHFSSSRPAIEYYKYGENQFMRCAYHIANWDVEKLIKEM